MPDRAATRAFIDAYRATFETLDVAAIVAGFTFPLQVIGDGGDAAGPRVSVAPDAAAFGPSIERIVGAYRALGVASARIERLDVTEVTPGTAQALVRWSLHEADGSPVYAFTAAYTVVDTADGPRIAAIAHDEEPKLRLALARRQGGRPA